MVSTTPQDQVLENDSHCENGGQDTVPNDKAWGGEELPVGRVPLARQLEVTSSP